MRINISNTGAVKSAPVEVKKQPVVEPKKKSKTKTTPIVDIVEEIKPKVEEDIEELLKEFETLED